MLAKPGVGASLNNVCLVHKVSWETEKSIHEETGMKMSRVYASSLLGMSEYVWAGLQHCVLSF